MSRRRSRLPSTAIASSSLQILSVSEFLKGLHRTPRKSRNGPTQMGTPAAATKAIPPPEGNQEDDFLLETLAAVEKTAEEIGRPITKRKLGQSVALETRFPKKGRKKHHVAYNSLALSRGPQNEGVLSLGEAREDPDPDPILSSITQTDSPVPIPLKPRYPVSVIRGSIISPWSRRGRNLTATTGEKELRVIPHEKNWGDRIDSLLVPGKVGARGIRGRAPSPKRALELANVIDRTGSPTRVNWFPHFVSFDSQLSTPDCSPLRGQGLAGTELGPELGFFQAPQANTESKKPAVAVQPVSQRFKRICIIGSTKLSEQTNKVTSEDRTAEPPPSLGVSELGPDGPDRAEDQGNATEKILPGASPGLSDITVENGMQGGSITETLGYPWERFDRSPTPFPSPEPGIAPRGSDCSSLLRFWESQLSKPSPDASPPGGGIGVCISPSQEPEGAPQFGAEEGTKKPPILGEEMDEGNSISSSAQLWEDYRLGHLELTSPPKQSPKVIPESPKSMPRSHQPAQVRVERVMLPPPVRQPRKLIDEDECGDNMDYINEISGRDYFSNAEKILNSYEDARLGVPPTRYNWKTNTISAKGQPGSKNVPKTLSSTHSLSPLSASGPARTYSNIPLKDIIGRRGTVPLRRPTISGSFKSPFLSKPPMTNMRQAPIPITPEPIRQGQEDTTMSIVNPSPFTIPAPMVPSKFVAESENRAKRHMTEFQSFSLPTGTRSPKIGPRRAMEAATLQPHRGMTIRFERSQKPFKPPLMTKPLEASRQPSGFDATNDKPVLVDPRRKVIAKTRAKSGRGKVGMGAQCAGMSKAAISSFVEVQAAW